jgi:AcrR family transcriptional regulator
VANNRQTESPSAGRPRDPALDRGILDATADVVARRGLSGTTIEEVARRAGTGKAAVYRRWPSKTELVIAAARALQAEVAIPDTGSLRGDLLACSRHYTSGDERATMMLANILREASGETSLREAAFEAIGRPPADALRTVIERWIAHGDIDATVPVDLLTGIIPSFAFRHLAIHGTTMTPATARSLVDDVLLPALQHRRESPAAAHPRDR